MISSILCSIVTSIIPGSLFKGVPAMIDILCGFSRGFPSSIVILRHKLWGKCSLTESFLSWGHIVFLSKVQMLERLRLILMRRYKLSISTKLQRVHVFTTSSPDISITIHSLQSMVKSVSCSRIDITYIKASCLGNMHDHMLAKFHIATCVYVSHFSVCSSSVRDLFKFFRSAKWSIAPHSRVIG